MLSRSSSGGDLEAGSAVSSSAAGPTSLVEEPSEGDLSQRRHTPDERLAELMRTGLSRSQALAELARESQEDELQELREGVEVVTALARVVMGLQGWKLYAAVLLWVIISSIYFCWLIVAFCFVILNVIGYLKTCKLVTCQNNRSLINWLLILQVSLLVSGILSGILDGVRKRHADVAHMLRTSRAKVCWLMCEVASLMLITLWCSHTRKLISQAVPLPTSACGQSMPLFMYWYAWALQVHKAGLFLIAIGTPPYKMLVSWAVRRGILVTGRAAKSGTVDRMQVVAYTPVLFANPDDPDDMRTQGQCCVCFEEYTSKKRIVRTPCHHYLHHSCLKLWLRASNSCPICRCNLEEASEHFHMDQVMRADFVPEPL